MEFEYIDTLPSDEESCYYAEHLEFHPNPDPFSLEASISDDELAAVLPHCPNITTAYLSGIPDLSSRTLILLAEHASHLTCLDITGCTHVTDLGLKAIATHSTSLRALSISRIPGTTDRSLAALIRGLPHLEELEIDNLPMLTALSVQDVWTFGRQLKRWSLAGCVHVTDKGFPWVARKPQHQTAKLMETSKSDRPKSWLESMPPLDLPPHHKLNDLRELNISHCLRVTDEAIRGVVAHCPRIASLNVAGCIELTDSGLRAVAELGNHLTTVDMGGLWRVTDAGVFALASACQKLVFLDVSYIPELTDLSILEIGTLPRLLRLAAAGLGRLTDQVAFFLAEHAFELEFLNMTSCTGLTLHGVQAMLRRLKRLGYLGLSGIPAMRRMGIRRFSELPPQGYDERMQGMYRVFRGGNIRALGEFLEKEEWRKREAERLNILFEPRADDSRQLY